MSCFEKSKKIFKKCFWVSFGISVLILFPLVILGEKYLLKFREDTTIARIDQIQVNNVYPSVSICQVFNGERNWDLSEKFYGEERDKRLDDFFTEIAFYTGACYTCELCRTDSGLECPKNFADLLGKFRENCQNLIKNCSWNDEPFECCEEFSPLPTEYGTCYTMNSALTKSIIEKEPLYDPNSIFGRLRLTTTEDIQIFIHHPFDVPTTYSDNHDFDDRILWGSTKDIIIKVSDATYDKSLLKKPMGRRHCRFSWEKDPSSIYDTYSVSTCETSCYVKAQMKFCSCSNHLMPMDGK